MISSVQYGLDWGELPPEVKEMLRAVCFTETPVGEIHSLIEIQNRQVNLSNYGLVFIKDNLKKKGVSPVFYLNNEKENHNDTIKELQRILVENPAVGKKILSLFSHFSSKDKNDLKKMDFFWEREWRFPASYGNFEFDAEDTFIGLCPSEEIEEFEEEFGKAFDVNEKPLKFIDPLKPNRWYATKLVQSRKRLNIDYSVV